MRSEAQRRACREWVPQGQPCHVDIHVDLALVGRHLIYAPLGLLLRYGYSFVSPLDGELYYGGTVVDKLPGVGVLIGSAWSWKAGELKVWEKHKGET